MQVVGILGGVASGKSLVAKQLQSLGAEILDGDKAGHEVLKQPEVEAAARARWGNDIFNSDGRVERPKLARIVFASTPAGRAELAYLEQLTHPRIRQLLENKISQLTAAGSVPLAVLDAPLMLKAGWHEVCDKILFVDAPREARWARARSRGWSEEDFIAREGAQESLQEKRQHADAVIDNSGSAEFTMAQVARLWPSLVG